MRWASNGSACCGRPLCKYAGRDAQPGIIGHAIHGVVQAALPGSSDTQERSGDCVEGGRLLQIGQVASIGDISKA